MWKWLIILLGMAAYIGLAGGAMAESTYDYGEETHCSEGKCYTTLYSGVRFVPEDGTWKKVEDAKRLDDKGVFSINDIEDDGIHGLEVVRFNHSCITIKPYSKDIFTFKYNTNIPVKIDGEIKGYIKIPSILSPLTEITFCPSQSAMAHNYTFGESSTTIQINQTSANSGYIYDTNCDGVGAFLSSIAGTYAIGNNIEGSGIQYRTFMEFDTSTIQNKDIISSKLISYIDTNTVGFGNATVYQCNYGTLATSDYSIATGTLEGIIFNQTSATSSWHNLSVSTSYVNASSTTQYCMKPDFACADADDYWYESDLTRLPYLEVVYNTVPLYWSSNSTNSTYNGTWISHNTFWTGDTLSGYIFSFNNGSNWTDGSCGDYTNGQCTGFGCSWTAYSCSAPPADCTTHASQSACENCGCTWTNATYTTKTYTSASMATKLASGMSRDAYTISTASGGTFAVDASPTFAETFGGITKYNLTTNGYTRISTSNNLKGVFNSSASGNTPFLLLNFTIAEAKSNIQWIYILLEQNNHAGTGTNEYCYYAIANWTSGAWVKYGAYVDGATDTNRTANFTNSTAIAYHLNGGNVLSLLAWGAEMDSGEGCSVDYAEVKVYYNNTANSCDGAEPTCSAQGASACSECGCSETSASCSGTPNYEMKNDSWVTMTGTQNWSNTTKFVNVSMGATIKWKVYANSSDGIWNATEKFIYTTTEAEPPEPPATCWYVSDGYCYLPPNCNVTFSDFLGACFT